jgi:hypothetical protein
MANVILELETPETGFFALDIQRTMQIVVSAAEAQKRVTRYVCLNLSNQMHGGTAVLVAAVRGVWRVPIHLTFPTHGDVGVVGTIDVDVETGELLVDDHLIKELEQHATTLAQRFTRTPNR